MAATSGVFITSPPPWRRMGSGGLRGLQNRCFGAEASKGWFDSDTPPPRKAEGRRQKAEGRRQKCWRYTTLGAERSTSAFCPLPSALLFGCVRQKPDLH